MESSDEEEEQAPSQSEEEMEEEMEEEEELEEEQFERSESENEVSEQEEEVTFTISQIREINRRLMPEMVGAIMATTTPVIKIHIFIFSILLLSKSDNLNS